MADCRYAGRTQHRLLRTHLRDCDAAGCEGCQPCTERHCRACGMRHVEEQTCAQCVGDVRDDLAEIVTLDGRMLDEAQHRGVESQAAMLAGPAADHEVWYARHRLILQRATVGTKADEARAMEWHYDNRDEQHPYWVLGGWDLMVTEYLGHDRTEAVSVTGSADYLADQLTYLAQRPDFGWEDMAREVRSCRAHLEDVLYDGERDERGTPCPMCGKRALVKDVADQQTKRCDCGPRPTMRHAEHGRCTCPFRLRLERPDPKRDPVLVRVYDVPLSPDHVHQRHDLACIACHREAEWDARHTQHGSQDEDRWVCPDKDCHAAYTEEDYRSKVEAVYVMHSDRLTASQIAATYRVPEGTVRRWANGWRDARGREHEPVVRKRGYDGQGRQLYDVDDVLAQREHNEPVAV